MTAATSPASRSIYRGPIKPGVLRVPLSSIRENAPIGTSKHQRLDAELLTTQQRAGVEAVAPFGSGGGWLDDVGVDLLGERVNGLGEFGVEVKFCLLFQEVVVGFALGELGLAVLADHHER
jgi:hypothetical protein